MIQVDHPGRSDFFCGQVVLEISWNGQRQRSDYDRYHHLRDKRTEHLVCHLIYLYVSLSVIMLTYLIRFVFRISGQNSYQVTPSLLMQQFRVVYCAIPHCIVAAHEFYLEFEFVCVLAMGRWARNVEVGDRPAPVNNLRQVVHTRVMPL